MMDEKMRILKMLEEGKVTAEDAARLLEAVGSSPNDPPTGGGRGKMLKILVTEGEDSGKKVNVNIPIDLVEMGLQFVPEEQRSKFESKGINLESINITIGTFVGNGKTGGGKAKVFCLWVEEGHLTKQVLIDPDSSTIKSTHSGNIRLSL